MKIGCYIEDLAHDAVVRGLAARWCPRADFEMGKCRGRSKERLRAELPKALLDLRNNRGCDILVILRDSNKEKWRDAKRAEWSHVPEDCRHISLFGVAERNIECWLAADRRALANELGCRPEEIPADDPSSFVKRRFGLGPRDEARAEAKRRLQAFVARAPLKVWIGNSMSFKEFYEDARRLAAQRSCAMPNEMDN